MPHVVALSFGASACNSLPPTLSVRPQQLQVVCGELDRAAQRGRQVAAAAPRHHQGVWRRGGWGPVAGVQMCRWQLCVEHWIVCDGPPSLKALEMMGAASACASLIAALLFLHCPAAHQPAPQRLQLRAQCHTGRARSRLHRLLPAVQTASGAPSSLLPAHCRCSLRLQGRAPRPRKQTTMTLDAGAIGGLKGGLYFQGWVQVRPAEHCHGQRSCLRSLLSGLLLVCKCGPVALFAARTTWPSIRLLSKLAL